MTKNSRNERRIVIHLPNDILTELDKQDAIRIDSLGRPQGLSGYLRKSLRKGLL